MDLVIFLVLFCVWWSIFDRPVDNPFMRYYRRQWRTWILIASLPIWVLSGMFILNQYMTETGQVQPPLTVNEIRSSQ